MAYQKPQFKNRYENYIGGEWVAPVDGEYFDDVSPVDGSLVTRVPKSNRKDIDLAVKAAWKAAGAWGKTSVTERSNLLFKIADRIEENLEQLALVETWGNLEKPSFSACFTSILLLYDFFIEEARVSV